MQDIQMFYFKRRETKEDDNERKESLGAKSMADKRKEFWTSY